MNPQPTDAQLVLGVYPANDADGNPIAYVLQVQRQDRLCHGFNPNTDTDFRGEGTQFRASNGLILYSSDDGPANHSLDDMFCVRGGRTSSNHNLCMVTPAQFERLQVAVAEYNNACRGEVAPKPKPKVITGPAGMPPTRLV